MKKNAAAVWIRSHMPTREQIEEIKWLRPVAHLLLRSDLWRFHRRSVPRGVALGLFVGIFLMIPGVQIAGAALLAVPLRANVPLSVGMTLLSNPLTTPFIVFGSMNLANRLFGLHADIAMLTKLMHDSATLSDYVHWFWSDAAPAVIGGLAIVGAVSAVIGYGLSIFLWRWWIAHKWRHRKHDRAAQ